MNQIKDAILEKNEGFPTNTKVQLYIYLTYLYYYIFYIKWLLNIFILYDMNFIDILHSPFFLLCYDARALPLNQ